MRFETPTQDFKTVVKIDPPLEEKELPLGTGVTQILNAPPIFRDSTSGTPPDTVIDLNAQAVVVTFPLSKYI